MQKNYINMKKYSELNIFIVNKNILVIERVHIFSTSCLNIKPPLLCLLNIHACPGMFFITLMHIFTVFLSGLVIQES